MQLFGRPNKSSSFRLFFATDIHGSERAFRKFVNAGKFYKVNALILGGDIIGKGVVPIIPLSGRRYGAILLGEQKVISGDSELDAFTSSLGAQGLYWRVMNEEEYLELQRDAFAVEKLFRELARERLEHWIELANERLNETELHLYMTGGNDDFPDVLEALDNLRGGHVVRGEGDLVELNSTYSMVSLGLSNPTPWKTPREVSEVDLANLIDEAVIRINDFGHCVFNLHAPPINSSLDTAAKIDESQSPPKLLLEHGRPIIFGAGSYAVRLAIEKFQPLLSLHGHIHESKGLTRIGKTLSINPGSEYAEGILCGAIVSLQDDRIQSYQLTTG